MYEVTAYATSEEYHLEDLSTALEQQGLYLVSSLPEGEALGFSLHCFRTAGRLSDLKACLIVMC